MIALYDLSQKPASFDFLQFLVTATTHGADHIRFYTDGGFRKKITKYQNPEIRFENIVKPACALAGVEYSIGPREGEEFYHGLGGVIQAYKKFGFIKKLKGTKPPVKNVATVTLRNAMREQRNSNQEAWMRFAGEIGARVIPDYADEPIDLLDRMALYEGSGMNYFVGNGPAVLCYFSDLPYCTVKVAPEGEGSGSPKFLKNEGLLKGNDLPWANENQKLFWTQDTYDKIKDAHKWALTVS